MDRDADQTRLEHAVARARERGILIPTFAQMADPDLIPAPVKDRLAAIGLWDVHPLNLFRISWHNEPLAHGGGFAGVNRLELPPALTGVDARIIALVGKWFPTGSHKVGATFGCLVPRLVRGAFDPTTQKAVWPSTGNFCRGGAYDAALLGCESIAILPEGMSRERFDWLSRIAGEVLTTPGGESNVKEIFDACAELRASRPDVVIFNQFEEYGNHLWHYHVTGRAAAEVVEEERGDEGRLAGFVAQSGSAGTLGAGDYLKDRYPSAKVAVGEALQCPTLLLNGYGDHRIEGIGDKHVPWIHNVRTTDVVMAIDDEACLSLLRLFNEDAGRHLLRAEGLPATFVEQLDLLGISGIGNLLSAITFAKYFELGGRDIVLTVLTDSADMYRTRLAEMTASRGDYSERDAVRDFHRHLMGKGTEHLLELDFPARKRIHNLKYFTWVEQQGKPATELDRQWDELPEYWQRIHDQVTAIDGDIEEFNARTGVLAML